MEVQTISLSKSPLVVGLVGAVPNAVNNLIWGFVGYQSKVAKELKFIWTWWEKERAIYSPFIKGVITQKKEKPQFNPGSKFSNIKANQSNKPKARRIS